MDSESIAEVVISSLGLVGDLASHVIFTRKKFDKFNARNLFKISLLIDNMCLILNLFGNINNSMDNQIMTALFCKIYLTLGFLLPAYSSWILVLISAERFLSVVYPTSKLTKIFGSLKFIMASSFFIFIFCFCTIQLTG